MLLIKQIRPVAFGLLSGGFISCILAQERLSVDKTTSPEPLFLFYYFTLHSNKPQEWVSGCFNSSFTALVFTGSKFTMQATPFLQG